MPTHIELITNDSFDEKFRDCIRDYFLYGFKSYKNYDYLSNQTFKKDWDRLGNILNDYMMWSEKYRQRTYMTQSSQAMLCNPFHRIYRFCLFKLSDIPFFLHAISALSNKVSYRNFDIYNQVLNLQDKQLAQLKTSEQLALDTLKLKTSELINLFMNTFIADSLSDRNRICNKKLSSLVELGLLRSGKRSSSGDNSWLSSNITLQQLLNYAEKDNSDFGIHLRYAIDFFSKNSPLGEIGMFLSDRFSNEDFSYIRVKHAYYAQAVNDFNLIDLLAAIDHGYWCSIEYRHAIAAFKTTLLAYPIEIRVSSENGRQHLVFYEPFKRSYTCLRLEFIDHITYYDNTAIVHSLEKCGFASVSQIESDILNAKSAIKSAWGVSTTLENYHNAVTTPQNYHVHMHINYTKKKEYYIKNRLEKECRFGAISETPNGLDFDVQVSNPLEMKPWIRSYYSRISDCSGFDSLPYCISDDVHEVLATFNSSPQNTITTNTINNQNIWNIPNDFSYPDESIPATEHNKIFNPVFSSAYRVISDVFYSLCSDPKYTEFTQEDLSRLIAETIRLHRDRLGLQAGRYLPEVVTEVILSGDLVYTSSSGMYSSKYTFPMDGSFYKDIVPLSSLELRWLSTIINDSKINYFLTPKEITLIRTFLADNNCNDPFSMDKIVYYDRYHTQKKIQDREMLFTQRILDSISKSTMMYIEYETNYNNIIKKEYIPLVLEYSNRDNRFQLYVKHSDSSIVDVINVSSILSLRKTWRTYENVDARRTLVRSRVATMSSVSILFSANNNMPDRILNEFSPWEKTCLYDEKTQLYKLTIKYPISDEKDILIRLMGYGEEITFEDLGHPITIEFLNRLNLQQRLIEQGENNT